MADDKSETGKPDRDRVSAEEDYEIAVLAKKFPHVNRTKIIEIVKSHGPMRADIEKKLDSITLLGGA